MSEKNLPCILHTVRLKIQSLNMSVLIPSMSVPILPVYLSLHCVISLFC
jgi:hypothetical protein